MERLVEITQDAAGVIEVDNTEFTGFFTGGIQSCLITVYECDQACVIVHDSGQLKIGDITKLVKKFGNVKKITTAFGPELNRQHNQERLNKILSNIAYGDREIEVLERENSDFAFRFPIGGDPSTMSNTMPSTVEVIPDKEKRMSMIELNNFFLTPNSQKLGLEIQFINGQYKAPRGLDRSVKEMIKIVKKQPDFFFANLAFLEKAHNSGVITMPKALLDVAKKYSVSEFMYRALEPSEKNSQCAEFRKFLQ